MPDNLLEWITEHTLYGSIELDHATISHNEEGLRGGSQQWLTMKRQWMQKKLKKMKIKHCPSIASVLLVNQYDIVYLIETKYI